MYKLSGLSSIEGLTNTSVSCLRISKSPPAHPAGFCHVHTWITTHVWMTSFETQSGSCRFSAVRPSASVSKQKTRTASLGSLLPRVRLVSYREQRQRSSPRAGSHFTTYLSIGCKIRGNMSLQKRCSTTSSYASAITQSSLMTGSKIVASSPILVSSLSSPPDPFCNERTTSS